MRARAVAVLVPGRGGALSIYTRRGPGPLQLIGQTTHLTAARLHGLHVEAVVLCGHRHAADLLEAALTHVDVYLVPAHWLAGVRPRAARAALAAHLVDNHRRAPVTRHLRLAADPIPF